MRNVPRSLNGSRDVASISVMTMVTDTEFETLLPKACTTQLRAYTEQAMTLQEETEHVTAKGTSTHYC